MLSLCKVYVKFYINIFLFTKVIQTIYDCITLPSLLQIRIYMGLKFIIIFSPINTTHVTKRG